MKHVKLSFIRVCEKPAAEILVLLDVVRLEADAVEVVPQLTLVALHPVHLRTHPLFTIGLGVIFHNF